jgi:Uma2 family endonuclease
MTAMIGLPRDHDWTVEDLALLPDDGLRYELVDGVLLVSPAPVPRHQRAARGVFRLLDALPPDELEVFFAPLDFQPTNRRSFEPDVLVVRRSDVGDTAIHKPLVLAVEVLSPSTRSIDLVLKRSMYEDAGVESYWVVDPDEPSVTVLELQNGRYVEMARVVGDQTVTVDLPYPVGIRPAALVEG